MTLAFANKEWGRIDRPDTSMDKSELGFEVENFYFGLVLVGQNEASTLLLKSSFSMCTPDGRDSIKSA